MIPLLVAAAVSMALQGASSNPREEIGPIVQTFIETLRSRDGARLAAVAQEVEAPAFGLAPVGELLETGRCPVVDRYDFSIDDQGERTATVRIALHGSAEAIGGSGQRFAMPATWLLSLVRSSDRWVVARAEPLDWSLGRSIAQASHDADREVLLGSAGDPRAAIRAVAEIMSGSGSTSLEAGLEVMRFAEGWAAGRGDLATVAFVQRRRSRFYLMHHQSDLAVNEAEKGFRTAEESADPDAKADALFGVAVASWLAGNDSAALRAFAQVTAMLPALTDPRPSIRALVMSSIILRKTDPRTALSYQMTTDELSTAYDWYRGNVDAAGGRGDLYSDIGDVDTAAHWYATALAQAPRILDHRYDASAAMGVAMCAMERGELTEARVQLERLAPTLDSGDVLAQLGRLLTRLGKHEEAERQLQIAIERGTRDEQWKLTALAQTYLAELRLAQRRDSEALAVATTALESEVRPEKTKGFTSENFEEWQTLLVAARALRRLHRTDEAIPMLTRAIELIEGERASAATDDAGSARFLDDKVAPYAELADILVLRGRSRDALLISERMRARSLRDALTTGHIDPAEWMTEPERQQEHDLNEALTSANRAFLEAKAHGSAVARHLRDESRAALNQFREDLYIKHPQLRARRPLELVSLNIPSALAHVAFVEYVVREQNTLILTARRSDSGNVIVNAKRIALGRDALAKRVERFSSAIASRDADTSRDSRALYDFLIAPIESELAGHEVCIIPNGPLWRLPFQVLLDPAGKVVLERHAVFYAPAMATLGLRTPRHQRAPRELLAMGDPHLDRVTTESIREQVRGGTFSALPSAAEEVRRIARLYPGSTTEVQTGINARESTFKAGAANYRTLHLATHGVVDNSAPMYSSLLLARGPQDDDDGLLEAREIAKLSLQADVAILSACDTAGGRIGAGEGVIGLAWAFMAAGCPTTVVSEGKTDSRATEELMVAFHRHLRSGENVAQALRHASLELRRNPDYANPFYWAAFKAIGSDTPSPGTRR